MISYLPLTKSSLRHTSHLHAHMMDKLRCSFEKSEPSLANYIKKEKL